MLKHVKRLLQVLVLVGLGLGVARPATASCIDCHDWYLATYARALEICQQYNGYYLSQGDCYCLEDEYGVYEALCDYFCLY
jgi:hypothetical protein